jgi:hypothetical protein
LHKPLIFSSFIPFFTKNIDLFLLNLFKKNGSASVEEKSPQQGTSSLPRTIFDEETFHQEDGAVRRKHRADQNKERAGGTRHCK